MADGFLPTKGLDEFSLPADDELDSYLQVSTRLACEYLPHDHRAKHLMLIGLLFT